MSEKPVISNIGTDFPGCVSGAFSVTPLLMKVGARCAASENVRLRLTLCRSVRGAMTSAQLGMNQRRKLSKLAGCHNFRRQRDSVSREKQWHSDKNDAGLSQLAFRSVDRYGMFAKATANSS